MATQTLPVETAKRTTRFRSTEPTTSSSTSATRSRRRTSTRARSASSSSRIAGPRPACAIARATCSSQNKIRLVLTTPLGPDGEIAEHVRTHGDGVRDIALWVDDARDAYAKARRARRRVGVRAARRCATTTAKSSSPAITIYGDTIHSLVERRNYRGAVHARLSCRDAALSGRRRPGC